MLRNNFKKNMRFVFLYLVFFLFQNAYAQIERYNNTEDTAKYIAPKDTITQLPMYGSSDIDFLNYLELNYNQTMYGQYLNELGTSISISFNVEKNGELSDIEISNTGSQAMASEFKRVLENMPKWQAGILDGKTKRTLMIYNLIVYKDNSIEGIRIEKTGFQNEYLNKSKGLKIFLLVGATLIMLKLLVIN